MKPSVLTLTALLAATYVGQFTAMDPEWEYTTSKPNRYGTVQHTLKVRTTWNDGTVTDNEFTVNQDSDGILYV